jgi:chromate transport protein ChrA
MGGPVHSSGASLPSTGNNTIDMFVNMFADDIKIAIIVFIVVVVVHFIPASSIISKYVAIDKIPYHDVIIRGLLCAVMVIIVRKALKI